LRAQLAPLRAKFLLLAALGFSFFVAISDLAVRIFYDQRYHAAAWILPLLTLRSWFSILANINEATLLGLGKPSYAAISNGLKFVFLPIGLPAGVASYGLFGAVVGIALVDLVKYLLILVKDVSDFPFESTTCLSPCSCSC
jgi:O-antigen/teichoic acid export membrane protein